MAFFFIISAVVLRLLPHLPNFTPIAALALFGGVYLNKKYALGVPLLAMFLSDIFKGFYSPWIMISVYGSFILTGLIGLWLKSHKKYYTVLGASVISSVIFFLVTNFAVWAVPFSFYQHSFQGLIQCYAMGLPFFKNTILGDLFYTGVLFGLMEALIYLSKNYYIYREGNGIGFARVARKRIQ